MREASGAAFALHLESLVTRRGEGKMATKKAADHTLYHLSSKGFWKKFRALPRLRMEEHTVRSSDTGP